MCNELLKYAVKPELYAPGTSKFWDDQHISKGLLAAHLNPNWDAATRRHEFIDQSVHWIAKIAPPSQYKCLLDLGCGPGLYAERFSRAGFSVTGVDFSRRSIAYAKEQTLLNKSNIEYHYLNYLTMEFSERYDVVTLIYCDYAALSITDRQTLLRKVNQALRPGGKLIFDVFTPRMRKVEKHSWQYFAEGGFWNEKPHICLESVYQYDDQDHTELRQQIVQTEETIACYNIWDHYFTREALMSEIQAVGFNAFAWYGDIAGKEFTDTGDTICVVVSK